MANNTGKILLWAGIAAAGIFAASKIAEGSSAQEPGGSLGGEDSSLTAAGNPFSNIDPNYQYPGPTNNYFMVNPDGSTTQLQPDANGDITIPSGDPNNQNGQDTVTPPPYINPDTGQKEPWYNNPFAQMGIFIAGGIGASEAYSAVKNKLASAKDSQVAKGEVKDATKTAEKSPIEKINENMGFKNNDPNAEIARGKEVTEVTARDPARLKIKPTEEFKVNTKTGFEGAKFENGKFITPKVEGAKITGGKVIGAIGTGLAVAQVGSSVVSTWKEEKPQNVKEAAIVTAQGTTNWLSDAFGFMSGIVYRPQTSAERYKDQNTGFFASFKDLADLGEQHRQSGATVGQRVTDVLGVSGYFNAPSSKVTPVSSQPTKTEVQAPAEVKTQTKSASGGSKKKGITAAEYYAAPSQIIKPTQNTVVAKPAPKTVTQPTPLQKQTTYSYSNMLTSSLLKKTKKT